MKTGWVPVREDRNQGVWLVMTLTMEAWFLMTGRVPVREETNQGRVACEGTNQARVVL